MKKTIEEVGKNYKDIMDESLKVMNESGGKIMGKDIEVKVSYEGKEYIIPFFGNNATVFRLTFECATDTEDAFQKAFSMMMSSFVDTSLQMMGKFIKSEEGGDNGEKMFDNRG